MKLCLFGTFHGAFWTIQSGSGPEFDKEFDFEVKKIGLRSEKIILKEFAGKFGTHFLLIYACRISAAEIGAESRRQRESNGAPFDGVVDPTRAAFIWERLFCIPPKNKNYR